MAGTQRIDFFINASAGNSTAQFWRGGKVGFYAEATWSGGSVQLQFQSPQGTWINVANGSLSANGVLILELPPGQYRAVGTTASAIYCSMITVPTITVK
jgi:hypothetical protein